MNVIKPLSLATLHKPFSLQGQHYLSIGALGFFTLGGRVSLFLPENLQWQKALKHLAPGQALDMAMPKGRAEFLVGGNAHAPSGKPVAKMQVTATVGEHAKTLAVHGDRQWYYGLLGAFHITEPEPFTKMPLGYDNAFGGRGCDRNPIGKGYYGKRFAALLGRNRGDMPNLEYPDAPVRRHNARLAPASLGATDIRWQPRCRRAGTYDERWVKSGFPGLAGDTDMALFNEAAEDQWAGVNWSGGEAYQLHGMHPQRPLIEGWVPEFRVRALLDQSVPERSSYQMLDLAADTLWFFPEEELGLVIYRGVADIADSDALDVKSLLLAYEDLSCSPRSQQHYQQTMERRLDRKTGPGEVLNEAALIPEPGERLLAERRAKRQAHSELHEQRSREFVEELKKAVALPSAPLAGSLGPDEMEHATEPRLPGGKNIPVLIPEVLSEPLSLDDIASGGVDLGDALENLDYQLAELQASAEKDLAEEQQRLQSLIGDLQSDSSLPGHSCEQLQQAIEKASLLPLDLHPQHGSQDPDIEELLSFLSDLPQQRDPDVTAQLGELVAMQRKARASQTALDAKRRPLSEDNRKQLGRFLADLLEWEEPMAGRDLTDVHLHGADFSGLDLRQMNFEGADLSSSRFTGANLSGANFLGARLVGADFSDACLANANFSQASCMGARFDRADLTDAFAVGADMTAASLRGALLNRLVGQNLKLNRGNLNGAQLDQAVLVDAEAEFSTWKAARLEKCLLSKSFLRGADFSGASMERTAFNTVTARESIWREARADRCFFGAQSDFEASSWEHADVRTCGMRESVLRHAGMAGVSFYQCDFSKADLSGADLRAAVLCRSLFTQALITDTDMRGVDLHQAICRKTDFSRSDLSYANLVQADLIGVVLKGTGLTDTQEQVA